MPMDECQKCGGDVTPEWSGNDHILHCDRCGFERYPTEKELASILCTDLCELELNVRQMFDK